MENVVSWRPGMKIADFFNSWITTVFKNKNTQKAQIRTAHASLTQNNRTKSIVKEGFSPAGNNENENDPRKKQFHAILKSDVLLKRKAQKC